MSSENLQFLESAVCENVHHVKMALVGKYQFKICLCLDFAIGILPDFFSPLKIHGCFLIQPVTKGSHGGNFAYLGIVGDCDACEHQEQGMHSNCCCKC